MPPCVDGGVDPELLRAARMLGYDDLGTALVQFGHKRVAVEFGAAHARPVIVHISNTDVLGPFSSGSFGLTDFLPGRTCIVLGPNGRNVDVYAHELVHAEIAHRIGFWTRWRRLPVWFDEGVAMQVDYRPAFDLPDGTARAGSDTVKAKATTASFFAASPQQLTRNFADAKQVVAA